MAAPSRRVAARTGGSSGIGRAVAEALVRSGWLIAVLDRRPPAAAQALPEDAIFYAVDVTKEKEVAAGLADLASRSDGVCWRRF